MSQEHLNKFRERILKQFDDDTMYGSSAQVSQNRERFHGIETMRLQMSVVELSELKKFLLANDVTEDSEELTKKWNKFVCSA